MALAGGVTHRACRTRRATSTSEGEILSPDGHCRAFDARRGRHGLRQRRRRRRAAAARRTRSPTATPIHAVIRGSAVNNDGSRKVGYLAPSVDGQARVVAEALAVAGVDAGHDRLRRGARHRHAGRRPDRDRRADAGLPRRRRRQAASARIGSVKTNIGHLDTAAGVASLIKVGAGAARTARSRRACTSSAEPRDRLRGDALLVVNAALRPWPRGDAPRRAGVSSLGVGGTNAHVIVEEAPAVAGAAQARGLAAPHALGPHAGGARAPEGQLVRVPAGAARGHRIGRRRLHAAGGPQGVRAPLRRRRPRLRRRGATCCAAKNHPRCITAKASPMHPAWR